MTIQDYEDAIFDELERDDDAVLANIRERRMAELQKEAQLVKSLKARDHGTYVDMADEKQVLDATTSSKLSVVHFYHSHFRRCEIMDGHLKQLASKHFKTRFVKINVEKAPFLVERLAVKVLPCVLLFIDGICVDRIVGFEDLGNADTFDTRLLERRMARSGVIRLQGVSSVKRINKPASKLRDGDEYSSDSE